MGLGFVDWWILFPANYQNPEAFNEMRSSQMTRRLVIFLIVLIFFPLSEVSSAQREKTLMDLLFAKKVPLSETQEMQVARLLQEGTREYLQELKTIDFDSFKGISGENAIALHHEWEMVSSGMERMIQSLDEPKNNPNSLLSIIAWQSVAREMSINAAYMDDLQSRGLIKSEWHVLLRMVLVGIFDNIIAPKLFDLVNLKRSNLGKNPDQNGQ